MKKRLLKIALFLLSGPILAACNRAVQTIEVTRIAPQTVEVTRIVPGTVEIPIPISQTATPTLQATTASKAQVQAAATSTLSSTPPAHPDQDTAYYDGVIVITRFCELFGHGLFAEAYQLLSPSTPHAISMQEYVRLSKILEVKTYRLISAQPYYEGDQEKQKKFWIKVYVEGEKGGIGAAPNGVHSYFATLIWENGEWKIYSIDTITLR